MAVQWHNSLQTVSRFLENDDNINELGRLAASEGAELSEKAHQNLDALGRILSRRKRQRRSSPAGLNDPDLRVFYRIDEQSICIPPEFHAEYETWRENWNSLFAVAGHSLRGTGNVLLEQYVFTRRIRQQTWKSTVCIRFLMLSYYHISLYDKGCEKTAALIARGSDNNRAMLDTLSDWIRIGERWNALCRDFGGYGAVFVLPQSVSDNTYMRIPLTGEKRQRIIAVIKNLGIKRTINGLQANELGLAICKSLLERRDERYSLPPWSLRPDVQDATDDSGPLCRLMVNEDNRSGLAVSQQGAAVSRPEKQRRTTREQQGEGSGPPVELSPESRQVSYVVQHFASVAQDRLESVASGDDPHDLDVLESAVLQSSVTNNVSGNSETVCDSAWALYGGMHNYRTVQFLLGHHALVDEESYVHVWDFAYRKKCSSAELKQLECITLNPPKTYVHKDWPEEQNFPTIHGIILRRNFKSLEEELNDNAEAVHLKDAAGRTALDWATARAQLGDMELLIKRGSSVNTMDASGRTTVLHAVDSHDDNALRIVLEAKANPDPKPPNGLFRSSPLHAACRGNLLGMVKILIHYGANVHAYNPEGLTPLHAVTILQHVDCAALLLDHGAEPDYKSRDGLSPLQTAIIHNSHKVLSLFIHRCNLRELKQVQLMPVISKYADSETMSMLASSNVLDQNLNRGMFPAVYDTLRSRTDYDETLGSTFHNL